MIGQLRTVWTKVPGSAHKRPFLEPAGSWAVSRRSDGGFQWASYEGVVTRQPARGTSQRLMDSIYRLLPEDQL